MISRYLHPICSLTRQIKDAEIFSKLNRQRNNIHSGGRSMPEKQLASVRELHLRYFSAAIEMMLDDDVALKE